MQRLYNFSYNSGYIVIAFVRVLSKLKSVENFNDNAPSKLVFYSTLNSIFVLRNADYFTKNSVVDIVCTTSRFIAKPAFHRTIIN